MGLVKYLRCVYKDNVFYIEIYHIMACDSIYSPQQICIFQNHTFIDGRLAESKDAQSRASLTISQQTSRGYLSSSRKSTTCSIPPLSSLSFVCKSIIKNVHTRLWSQNVVLKKLPIQQDYRHLVVCCLWPSVLL